MAEALDTLSKYGQSFQSKVISALLTDAKLLDSLSDIIHKKFFESEANKWIVETIKDLVLMRLLSIIYRGVEQSGSSSGS